MAGLAVLLALTGLSFLTVFASGAVAACLPNPSACGYPDATNTGVPAGISLTPSGSKTVSTNGAVLSGLDITGTVTVTADNVTIENSRIAKTSGGSGSYAVILNNGADNFTIRDSEISGPASNTSGLQSAVWNHYNNPGALATRIYFHRCADCWEGAGTFRDAYMVVDAAYSGSHDEDIYVCGTSVDVDHSTLVNTHQQTATVFGDTICGGNDFTVTDSLLAGGGYVLYPQANSSSETGSTLISGNRIARCKTTAVYNPGSGGTACSGGGDSFGYYPLGGYYGIAAYTYSGPDQIWENNVWDDSSQPICDDGRPGCGTASPPPEEPEPPEEEEEEEEEEPAPPNTPASAIWTAPTSALVGIPVTLDGSASGGDGPLACDWLFENQGGTTVWETHTGCTLPFTFQVPDTKYVKLRITDADGEVDSNRQSFPVLADSSEPPAEPEPGPGEESAPPGEPPVATAAHAALGTAGDDTSSASPPAVSRLRAVWRLPAHLRAGQRITLGGWRSRGPAPLSCIWTVRRTSRGRAYRRHSGCSVHLRVPRSGTRYLRLTVWDGFGRRDSLQRAIGT